MPKKIATHKSIEKKVDQIEKIEVEKPANKTTKPSLMTLSFMLVGLLLAGFVFGGLLGIYHDYTSKNDRITYYRPARNISPLQDPEPENVIFDDVAAPANIPATGGDKKQTSGSSDTATYTIQIYAPVPSSEPDTQKAR